MRSAPFSRSAQRLAVVVADLHEGLAPIVAPPPMRSLNGRAWTDRRLGHAERERDDRALHLTVTRLAARVSEREVDEDETRDTGLFDDVSSAPDDHGGDAGFFESTGDQTHGLVTDGSEWNEQGDVDAVLHTPFCDPVRVEARLALAVLGRDPEEAAVHRADHPIGDQRTQ